MPPEPERLIEKLLRRVSKERRQRPGDSWQVHPATRRLWQQEVARRFGRDRKVHAPWWLQILGMGWLRIAGAAVAVMLLGYAGLSLLYRSPAPKQPAQMSENRPAPPPLVQTSPQLALDDAPKLIPEQETLARRSRLLEEKLKNAPENQLAAAPSKKNALAQDAERTQSETPQAVAQATASTPSTALSSAEAAATPLDAALAPAQQGTVASNGAKESSDKQEVALGASKDGQVASVAYSVTSTVGPASAPARTVMQYGLFNSSQTFDNTRRDEEVALRTRSAQAVPALAKQSQAANGILVSFRMEQEGQQLNVIDRDGSVYSGPIELTNVPSLDSVSLGLPAANALSEPALKTERSFGIQNQVNSQVGSVFRVIGTNRSSNQKVVFSGTILPATNDVTVAGRIVLQRGGIGGALNQRQTSATNLLVNGTAVIDGSEKVQILAVPAGQ